MSAPPSPRAIAVVTGTRAEFGLLRPVMRAVQEHCGLELRVIACGAHLLPPQHTVNEVKREFPVDATVEMQGSNTCDRFTDAKALGGGIAGFARVFADNPPDVVVVLGDRIEAFAAAAAASVSGIRVAHMHGGDRAEGIADEAMRHAITKLAHIHLPATQRSALRIIAMGEDQQRVHMVGSPAIDGLDDIPPLNDREFAALGSPRIVVVLHPIGDDDSVEFERAARLLEIAQAIGATLVLHPNHDPGRGGIVRAIEEIGSVDGVNSDVRNHSSAVSASSATSMMANGVAICAHLPRDRFIGLLRRAKVIVGNSSAALIECAAIPIRAIDVGRRQAGREMPENVISIPDWNYQTIQSAIKQAVQAPPLTRIMHPYGDGCTGPRVAESLASVDLAVHHLRKRNAY